MKKEGPEQKNASDLREQAEKRLNSEVTPIEKMSEGEVRRLVHELRVHQIELEMQNDELRRAQIQLEESRNAYSILYDYAPVGYLTVDDDGLITKSNLTFSTLLGRERSLLINKPLSNFIAGEDQDKYYLYRNHVYEKDEQKVCELKMVRKDGAQFYAQMECEIAHSSDEKQRSCLTIITDITGRKRAEEEIKASLKEKELLLREVYHRVKNNLQIIISLLRMQSENIEDMTLLDEFRTIRSRIMSMSLVHDDLYQNNDMSKINYGEYVCKLTGRLITLYGLDHSRIKTSLKIDNVFLPINRAIPCGMLITELFTNSLKYAFRNHHEKAEEEKCEIRIKLYAENNRHTLIFSDNGIGLPEGIGIRNPETMGLGLVQGLVEQIDGTIELNRKDGTEFKITFKT